MQKSQPPREWLTPKEGTTRVRQHKKYRIEKKQDLCILTFNNLGLRWWSNYYIQVYNKIMGGACSKSKKSVYIASNNRSDQIERDIAEIRKQQHELQRRVNNIIVLCEGD